MTSVGIAWRAVMTDHLPPPGDPPGRTPLYSVLRIALGTPLRGLARIRVSGAERIPRKGPVMIAANHLSHIDPILVIAGSRRKVHYMAKQEHFGHPLIGPVMRAIGQIETDRQLGASDALAQASGVLADGRVLGIFPEGTRSRREVAPLLQSGKTGIARLAAANPDVPVHPCAIIGSREMWSPIHHRLPRLHRPVAVRFGHGVTWNTWLADPAGGGLDLDGIEGLSKDPESLRDHAGALFRGFTDQMMASIGALGAP